MINYYEIHRHLIDRERELLEKRAEYEARVDDALAALKSARQEQAAVRGNEVPATLSRGIHPLRWFRLRVSQSGGQP